MHFDVADCKYEFERAVTEGYSDHATIRAELFLVSETTERSDRNFSCEVVAPNPEDDAIVVPSADGIEPTQSSKDNRRFAVGAAYWEGMFDLLEKTGLIKNARPSSHNRASFEVVGWNTEYFQPRVCYCTNADRVCFLIKTDPALYDTIMRSRPELDRRMPTFGGWKTENRQGENGSGHFCVDVLDVDARKKADFGRQQQTCANTFKTFYETLDPIIQALQRDMGHE